MGKRTKAGRMASRRAWCARLRHPALVIRFDELAVVEGLTRVTEALERLAEAFAGLPQGELVPLVWPVEEVPDAPL